MPFDSCEPSPSRLARTCGAIPTAGTPETFWKVASRAAALLTLHPFARRLWLFGVMIFACAMFMSACGYHVGGKGERIPPEVQVIAIPIFTNESSTFHIEQSVSRAVMREFLERTKFQVTPDPTHADAVLKGTVKNVSTGVLTFDISTGRATSMQVQVTAAVELVDMHTKKTIFANPHYTFREQYQVSQNPSGQIDEEQPALNRLSQDMARTLVTEILEDF
jgi:outer membrane lipopolysaccharide assembly protein LptE/RlpB